MHVPDSMLDPRVAAATALVGAAGLFYCVRKVDRQHGERTTVLMGTMAAFVFAAQMVNFPVGLVVSGHLLGGVLAAVLLGPWAGAVVIAAVLLVQCFVFADGGATALGANFVNMGLIGSVGGYAIYAPLRRLVGGQKGILIGAMAAAWFSVLMAAGALTLELGLSGYGPAFFQILSWMVLVHAAIGLGEALITGLVVRFIVVRRPDLFDLDHGVAPVKSAAGPHWGQIMLGGLGVALTVAIFLAPFAYEQPDGLEFVGKKVGFLREDGPGASFPAPIPDYLLKVPGVEHVKVATAAAGVVGTLVVFGVAWGMAREYCRLAGTKKPRPMRLEGLESYGAGPGPLQRADARIKLIAALVLILVVVATPFGSWTALGCEGLLLAFIVGLAGIPPRELARRWLAFLLLAAFLTLMVAPAHPARTQHGLWIVAASILIKNGLALLTMLVLAGTTPLVKLLAAFRKLGAPAVLVGTLQFMERYRHVLIDELNRMSTARRARTFDRRGGLAWTLLTGLIGMLFLRTFERAERVHGAMVARGWDGVLRTLED